MFKNIKRDLYFMRLDLMFKDGLKKGDILPFDNDFKYVISSLSVKVTGIL